MIRQLRGVLCIAVEHFGPPGRTPDRMLDGSVARGRPSPCVPFQTRGRDSARRLRPPAAEFVQQSPEPQLPTGVRRYGSACGVLRASRLRRGGPQRRCNRSRRDLVTRRPRGTPPYGTVSRMRMFSTSSFENEQPPNTYSAGQQALYRACPSWRPDRCRCRCWARGARRGQRAAHHRASLDERRPLGAREVDAATAVVLDADVVDPVVLDQVAAIHLGKPRRSPPASRPS